jgi:hypothetical protein
VDKLVKQTHRRIRLRGLLASNWAD